jgi:hypothetical protein
MYLFHTKPYPYSNLVTMDNICHGLNVELVGAFLEKLCRVGVSLVEEHPYIPQTIQRYHANVPIFGGKHQEDER